MKYLESIVFKFIFGSSNFHCSLSLFSSNNLYLSRIEVSLAIISSYLTFSFMYIYSTIIIPYTKNFIFIFPIKSTCLNRERLYPYFMYCIYLFFVWLTLFFCNFSINFKQFSTLFKFLFN